MRPAKCARVIRCLAASPRCSGSPVSLPATPGNRQLSVRHAESCRGGGKFPVGREFLTASAALPARHALDGGDQLAPADRLLQIFGDPGGARAFLQLRIAAPGDQDDRNAEPPAFWRAQEIDPAQHRQVLVEYQAAAARLAVMPRELGGHFIVFDLDPMHFSSILIESRTGSSSSTRKTFGRGSGESASMTLI